MHEPDSRIPIHVSRERLTALLALLLVLIVGGSDALAASAHELPEEARSAIAADDPEQQLELARRYEHGEGVPRDVGIAVRLYCHAADAGNADAEYALGWLYANARGVARDDTLAAAWFARAAGQGDAHAERMLARLEVAGPERAAETASCVLPDGVVYRHGVPLSVPNPSREVVADWVRTMSPEFGLEPELVLAVVRAESAFNARALSPKRAMGLMQLIPETAARFGVQDPWDPVQNLRGGMAYLRWLLDFFDGNETFALAGYNAGERAVQAHGGIPPYPETRAYVKRVSVFRARETTRVNPS